jgi:anti-sigma B factor antagonist
MLGCPTLAAFLYSRPGWHTTNINRKTRNHAVRDPEEKPGGNRPVQSETKSRVDQLTSPAGHAVAVLRFEGDIASTSKEAVLGTYQSLPKATNKLILLDFSKVDYINSSGIALVIQLLIEAANSSQKVYAFGLSPHFTKVFTMVGITKYAELFPSETEALAAL